MPPKMQPAEPSAAPIQTYEVGYGKPPRSTQFQKGRSGNPKGRPKNSLNAATELEAILSEIVTIRENGREVKISKLRLMLLTNVNNAIKSHGRSFQNVMALMQRTNVGSPPPDEGVGDTSVDDQAMLERYFAELHVDAKAGEAAND